MIKNLGNVCRSYCSWRLRSAIVSVIFLIISATGCAMCGCFGNVCICIYCVFCTVFFRIVCVCIFILICFVDTSLRATATVWQFNCSSSSISSGSGGCTGSSSSSSSSNKRRSCHTVTFRSSSLPLVSARTSQRRNPFSVAMLESSAISSTSSRTSQKVRFHCEDRSHKCA
jgi:hypothetical protein